MQNSSIRNQNRVSKVRNLISTLPERSLHEVQQKWSTAPPSAGLWVQHGARVSLWSHKWEGISQNPPLLPTFQQIQTETPSPQTCGLIHQRPIFLSGWMKFTWSLHYSCPNTLKLLVFKQLVFKTNLERFHVCSASLTCIHQHQLQMERNFPLFPVTNLS